VDGLLTFCHETRKVDTSEVIGLIIDRASALLGVHPRLALHRSG